MTNWVRHGWFFLGPEVGHAIRLDGQERVHREADRPCARLPKINRETLCATVPDQKLCTGVRTNYEPTYQPMKREVYVCCAGWETETTIADGCLKPTCRSSCRNGGRCTAPDTCTCPAGFTGPQCAEDINECKRHKPCDQTCYNTEGSYYCTCREGFQLQSDRQSCKRMDESNDVASEARDMENDVDYDSLDTRLTKLEKIILSEDRGRSQSETHELSKKVQYALDAVSSLRSQVSRLTQRLFPVVDYGNRIN
ncbi:hypothetical protein pipiens_015894 [Culex pipiens pipiens]|uniref:EGF-like domain-containing protein n=1 Tax=Culex pipiens pipiens TaxID=38569 RepID=A0ABD1CNI8_CULPP